jgi:DNA-binding transcriptional regulator YiaG
MMFCPSCNAEMRKSFGSYQFRESGLTNVWLDEWPLYVCPNRHDKIPLLPDASEMTRLIARQIVEVQDALEPDYIRFLRESLGLKGQELATIIGVSRGEVSRWENGHSVISAFSDFKLRLEAIDRLLSGPEHREAREAVTMLFQRVYRAEKASEASLRVHASSQVLCLAG